LHISIKMKKINEVVEGMSMEEKDRIVKRHYEELDGGIRRIITKTNTRDWDFSVGPSHYFNGLISRIELEHADLWNLKYDRFFEDAVNRRLNEGELYSSRLK
jgi:hypothetical protein